MNAIVGKNIVIENYTKEAEKFFYEKLTFDNPEYYKKVNSGRWVGDTPKTLSLLQRHKEKLVIPFGMLPIVFENRRFFDNISHNFRDTGGFDYGSKIKPYDYQEKAIKAALKARQGVVVAPCGAGKTQIGLEIAARIGGSTLWLTHTTDLLNQSMDRAKTYFDSLSDGDYGTITAGKVDIGRIITFATVQTMSKIDLSEIEHKFDTIIVDECHHVVGTPTKLMMFYHVISSLCARYKFGLTATPKRTDGLTPCMFALIGSKVYEIGKDEVDDTTCPVKVEIMKTNYAPDMGKILMPDGTISYSKFVSDIIADDERNEQIAKDVANADGTCLLLTDRIEHIRILKKKLEDKGIAVEALSASASKKDKEARVLALKKLKEKKIKAIVATYALAKEGLDVPTLDNLFMTTPQKNDIIITQSAGRVARKAEGKKFGKIYDYQDKFSMLISWQKKRNAIYKRLGFEIV